MVIFLMGFLQKCLNISNISLAKFIFPNTSEFKQKYSITATILVIDFLCTIWYNQVKIGNKQYLKKKS